MTTIHSLSYINLQSEGWLPEDIDELAEELKVAFGDAEYTLVSLEEVAAVLVRWNMIDKHANWHPELVELLEVTVGLMVNLEEV